MKNMSHRRTHFKGCLTPAPTRYFCRNIAHPPNSAWANKVPRLNGSAFKQHMQICHIRPLVGGSLCNKPTEGRSHVDTPRPLANIAPQHTAFNDLSA